MQKTMVIVVGLVLVVGTSIAVNGAGGNVGEVKLSAIFSDAATDGVRSDDGRTYVNGRDAVRAFLFDNYQGNFVLDTNSGNGSPSRTLVIDFQGQSGAPAGGPVDTYSVTAVNNTVTDNLRTLTAGTSALRGLVISWVQGSNSYQLRWNALTDGSGGTSVQFTCLSDHAAVPNNRVNYPATCSRWTVAPTGQAALFRGMPGKRATTWIGLGSFTMPFEATLSDLAYFPVP